MFKNLFTFAAVAMLSLTPMAANAQSAKLHGNVINGYHNGYEDTSRYYEEWTTWNVGIWTFENGEMTPWVTAGTTADETTLQSENRLYGNCGAVYVDGFYYTFFGREKSGENDPGNYDTEYGQAENEIVVRKWDATTWEMLSEEVKAPTSDLSFTDLTYDPIEGRVYCVYLDIEGSGDDAFSNYYFGWLDLDNMEVHRISQKALSMEIRALAANPNGKLYGIGYAASPYGYYFVEIDKATGDITEIGNNKDANNGRQAIQRTMQSAVCDWRDGKMYWIGPMNAGKTKEPREQLLQNHATALYQVDIATGRPTMLMKMPLMEQVTGLWVEGDYIVPNHDLKVDITSLPLQAEVNELLQVNATVKNLGNEDADSYSVNLYVNGKKVNQVDGTNLASKASAAVTLEYIPTVADGNELSIYVEVNYANDQTPENNKTDARTITLIQSTLPTVALTGMEEDGVVYLAWEAPQVNKAMTEDFERYSPFTIDAFGDWTTWMNSGAQATVVMRDFMGDYQYPNAGKPFAWQVFNADEAGIEEFFLDQSVMDDEEFEYVTTYPTFAAHSGKQTLVSAVGAKKASNSQGYEGVQSDNWLVSPRLSGTAQTISFYAKCWRSNIPSTVTFDFLHYTEKFNVLYSTGRTLNIDDFQVLEDGSEIEAALDFGEGYYEFELPNGANYFAIQCVSDYDDGFFLFLDDITYMPKAPTPLGYNVYRDGVKVNNKPVRAIDWDEEMLSGTHVYNVTVVYVEGESAFSNPVQIGSGMPTAISNVATQKASNEDVYNINGQYVGKNIPAQKGVYIVNGHKVVVR